MVGDDRGVVWGAPIISVSGDLQPIEAFHQMPAHAPRWGQGLKDWMRENYRRLHRMYSQTTNFPSPRHYCDLDPTVKDKWGQPALRITHEWDEIDARTVDYLGTFKSGSPRRWERSTSGRRAAAPRTTSRRTTSASTGWARTPRGRSPIATARSTSARVCTRSAAAASPATAAITRT